MLNFSDNLLSLYDVCWSRNVVTAIGSPIHVVFQCSGYIVLLKSAVMLSVLLNASFRCWNLSSNTSCVTDRPVC
jgi:hypothetical protein